MSHCTGMLGRRCTCGLVHDTALDAEEPGAAAGLFRALPFALAGWALLIVLPAIGWWQAGLPGALCGVVIAVTTCVLATVILIDECMADDAPSAAGKGPAELDEQVGH